MPGVADGGGGGGGAGGDAARAHTYRGRPLAAPLAGVATPLAHLARQARARGEAPYLTAVADDGRTETVSFGRLDRRARAFAVWLAGEHPGAGTGAGAVGPEARNDAVGPEARNDAVGPEARNDAVGPEARNDVVGLVARNDVASVVAIFGTLAAGRPLLLLSPGDPAERVAQQAAALGATTVLGPGDLPAPAALDGLRPGPPARPARGADAFYLGTSGSTAASKLVAQTHYAAGVNAAAVVAHHRLGPGDRFLGCLPIHHVNGLHFSLLANLAAGSHLVLAESFSPFGYGALVERYRPRVASVVPSIIEALVASWRRPAVPAELAYLVTAAAPLPPATARAARAALGVRVVQGYGLTETVNFSTTMPPDLPAGVHARLTECEFASVGTAVFGNEVGVLGDDGRRLPPGEVGEVCMRGHNVMDRYAGNPAATAEAFRHGWFHSGDLGHEVEVGAGRMFVVLTGRIKNVAKVGGESVSLDEVDRALRALPYVVDAAALAVPDRWAGEELIAAVALAGPAHPDDATIRADLARILPAAAVPRRIVRRATIPRTATGKLLRPRLAEELSAAGAPR
jgi:long-chain acyl-CoA synthetase